VLLEYVFRDDEGVLTEAAFARAETEWGVTLNTAAREHVRNAIREHVAQARWSNASRSPRRMLGRAAQRTRHYKIERTASLLIKLLHDEQRRSCPGSVSLADKSVSMGLPGLLPPFPAALKILATAARYQPASEKASPPKGRPSYAHWRAFVVALARVCKGAGGKPSTAWRDYDETRVSSFWKGVAVLNTELPADVRARSISGLAEHVHKHGFLIGLRAGRK
jgi:hypothetical protein